ncbi:MAG TPA: four helix bundle protein [Bacteroidales bacterium]|nr:four helix bundle protein [Bacteroidales bacterium]HPS15903.1 four helix bundle protein [Bacteroidales bacterium]
MNNFKQLKVWQKAVELTTNIYKETKTFPSQEQFGIISQITRSVVSIPSNIAEGSGRTTSKDFNHFLSIALGSSFETETLLIISNNLGYLNKNNFEKLVSEVTEIQKMLRGLQKSNLS